MKTKVLTALKEADDYISGQELCERFGVSRTAIWKAVNQLKEAGYEIEAIQNKGYKILSVPDRLSESELQSIRKTSWAGKEIFYYDVIDSTNTRAKQLQKRDTEREHWWLQTVRMPDEADEAEAFFLPRAAEFIFRLCSVPGSLTPSVNAWCL